MATTVCDKTPCDYMQAALDALVSCNRSDEFVLMAHATVDPRVLFAVPLRYCPFCGTRIDPQWVKNFQKGFSLVKTGLRHEGRRVT